MIVKKILKIHKETVAKKFGRGNYNRRFFFSIWTREGQVAERTGPI